MENQAKKCNECGKLLTFDHFRLTPLSADGHANICKECAKQKRRKKRDEFVPTPTGGGVTRTWQNSRHGSLSRNCAVGAIQVS